jgi:hypothetical protein
MRSEVTSSESLVAGGETALQLVAAATNLRSATAELRFRELTGRREVG